MPSLSPGLGLCELCTKLLPKQANPKYGSSPHLFPIRDAHFSLTMDGSFGWRAEAPFVFLGTIDVALASDRLEAFVRQEKTHGVELVKGSDLERAPALLVTIRWSEKHNLRSKAR